MRWWARSRQPREPKPCTQVISCVGGLCH
jgi:hypothetical protein